MARPDKKEMKKILKECIKNLDKLGVNDEMKVVIIQFKTREQEYVADFHVNEDALLGADE